jgi:hypothetical protein
MTWFIIFKKLPGNRDNRIDRSYWLLLIVYNVVSPHTLQKSLVE